jgi:phage-related protein
VAVTFEQYAEDSDGLQAFIDDIREMESWGVGTLTKHCGDEGDRYCLARVNSVTRSESPGENGGMKLTATVNFLVAEPYWLTDGTWNTPVAITANNTNRPVNGVGGVFKTYPKFTLTVTSGTLSFVQIYWGTGGSDVREVILNGFTAGVGDIITIDCRTMEVLHDGSNAFSYVSSFRHANFIWLDPGNNLITINPSGGAITATAAWYERY